MPETLVASRTTRAMLDSPLTRAVLWIVAGIVAGGALWALIRYLPGHPASDGFGYEAPRHGGLIVGQVVAAFCLSVALIGIAALLPEHERQETPRGTYVLLGVAAVAAAGVLVGIDVLGPDLADRVNLN